MPDFPRTVGPRDVWLPEVSAGFRSQGQTGKTQLRTNAHVGRRWREAWPPLRHGDPDVEALIVAIEEGYHQGIIYDVDHRLLPGSGKAPNGAGGGAPLIKGAGQTGDTILTDGWALSVTNVVRAGDVIRIAGRNVLCRILDDANSDVGGNATLRINPPYPVGSSPGDNAVITRSGAKLRAYIAEYTVPKAPPGVLMAGVAVTFQEAP